MYYVYILKSKKDSKLYLGFTNDLKRRLKEHNDGLSQATKLRKPFELVYYESFKSKTDAMRREKGLKQFKSAYSCLKKRISASLKS